MRRLLFIFFVALLFFYASLGITQTVTLNDLQKVSTNFVAQRSSDSIATMYKPAVQANGSIEELKDMHDRTVAYISHLDPAGFLVISTELNIAPVIAYSFRKNWPADFDLGHPLCRVIIEDLRLRKAALPNLPESIKEHKRREWQQLLSWTSTSAEQHNFTQWPPEGTTSTGGWLKTTWHQFSPYNDFCPVDPHTGERSYPGCVATALAQIINFHEYIGDASLGAHDTYQSTPGLHIDDGSAELDFPPFDIMNNYLDTIRKKYHDDMELSDQEKAALNFACGILLKMRYSSLGSSCGGNSIDEIVVDRFGYYAAMQTKFSEESLQAFRENMMIGLPAQLNLISNQLQGHSVVVDGYNTDGFFHLNFGWGSDSPSDITEVWYMLPDDIPFEFNIISDMIFNIRSHPFTQAHLSVSDSLIVYDPSIYPNESEVKTVILCNETDDTVRVQSVEVSENFLISLNGFEYVSHLNPFTLDRMEEVPIYVKCVPNRMGQFTGKIAIFAYGHESTVNLQSEIIAYSIPEFGTYVADQEVSGEWSNAGSPYYVFNDIQIQAGRTLAIGPGTAVYFMGPHAIEIGSEAQLVVKGTEDDSVLFDMFTDEHGGYSFYFVNSGENDTLAYCVFSGLAGLPQYRFEGTLSIDRTDLVVSHSKFCNGVYDIGSIVYMNNSSLDIIHSDISNNAMNNGAVIQAGNGILLLEDCRFFENSSENGQVLHVSEGETVVNNCDFYSNSAKEKSGGAIYSDNESLTIYNSHFYNNRALNGGAVKCNGGLLDIGQTDFHFNSSANGGALSLTGGQSWIDSCTFNSNSAPYGGAIRFDECLSTIVHSEFEGNIAKGGGTLFSKEANVIARFCDFFSNTATRGGAIGLIGGTVQIESCRIHENIGESGGAVNNNSGEFYSYNSFLFDNRARYGGMYFGSDASSIISNCTIAFSHVMESGRIFYIEDNHIEDDTLAVSNSILWGNDSESPGVSMIGGDLTAASIKFSYSDVDTTSQINKNIIVWGEGMLYNIDPLFENYESRNFLLREHSPCIDAGDPFMDIGSESFPHGYRINMGGHGGTDNAQHTSGTKLTVLPLIDFGESEQYQEIVKTVYLKNGSIGTITITGFTLSDTMNFEFLDSVANIACALEPMVLEPGDIDSLRIRFSPLDINTRDITATLTISMLEIPDIVVQLYLYAKFGIPIGGQISGFLTKQGFPYIVEENLTIPDGESLAIEPGVIVEFKEESFISVGPGAQLRAMGTETDSIYFRAFEKESGWRGVLFSKSGDNDTLAYCVIEDVKPNYLSMSNVEFDTSAVTVDSTNLYIAHCFFRNNESYYGGALFLKHFAGEIVHSRITRNQAHHGGAFHFYNSTGIISHCEIAYNEACWEPWWVVVHKFWEDGGAMIVKDSSPIFQNCFIFDNKALYGSAIYSEGNSSPLFINTTISQKWDIGHDALIYIWSRHSNSSVTFRNSIIWNYSPWLENVFLVRYGENATLGFEYCDIDTTNCLKKWFDAPEYSPTIFWDQTTKSQEPLFVDVDEGILVLTENSPCVDAGNPAVWYNDSEDPNNPGYALWPSRGTIRNDMGAYGGKHAFDGTIASVGDNTFSPQNPTQYNLYNNYPNPFNNATIIKFELPRRELCSLVIYNMLGQKIKALIDSEYEAGIYSIPWDGTDFNGNSVVSGIYFYKLTAGDFTKVHKMVLAK